MKLSLSTLSVLLPLVTSSLKGKVSNNNNNAIVSSDPVPDTPSQFTWRKSEVAAFVRELRHMYARQRFFSESINVEKILLGREYSEMHTAAYYQLLSQRIISIAGEAVKHGLKIGGGLKKLLENFDDDTKNELLPFLMASNVSEAKAAIISVLGHDEKVWNEYYHVIEKDEEAQKRLLELIDMTYSVNDLAIVLNWGRSLKRSRVDLKIALTKYDIITRGSHQAFRLYLKYSLYYRKMSPRQVVIELLKSRDFEGLISTLKVGFVPSEETIEPDTVLASMLSFVNLNEEAWKILSKIPLTVPDGDMKLLKLATGLSPWGSSLRRLMVKKIFNLDDIADLDLTDGKIVEKLFRSGHLDEFSFQFSKIFDPNFPQAALMKIGEMAALLVFEIVSNPAKYPWATSDDINQFIQFATQSMEFCGLSFNMNNPIVAALDSAFDGGKLVDFYCRYKSPDIKQLKRLFLLDRARGYYSREIAFLFGLNRLIGNDDFSKNQLMRKLSVPDICAKFDDKVQLWRALIKNVIQPMNYQTKATIEVIEEEPHN